MLSYSVVVPTVGTRPDLLAETLRCLAGQRRNPLAIFVVLPPDGQTTDLSVIGGGNIPLHLVRAEARSAAAQRNAGAALATGDLVLFCDDDLSFAADLVDQLCEPFERENGKDVGGVAARMEGMTHRPPRGLNRVYCRLQAGYPHPHYGGRLIGAAVNFCPAYEYQTERWIRAEWLNSGCVLYRREVFAREQFPGFSGYSFMEDVHLSARVARTHRLYFHREAIFVHRGESTAVVHGRRELVSMQMRNRRTVARDVLHLPAPTLAWKFFLYRLFETACLLRQRAPGWTRQIVGTWTA